MAPRLIVHAGFHKTGTTSVQRSLAANRARLHGHLDFMLRADMKPLCDAARTWSVSRDPVDLGLVQYEATLTVENWSGSTPLLLSSEDLSGHMPGRRGLRSYDAAPHLAQAMVTAWQEAHPSAEITLLYTTRAAGPWLASCYTQHLRATRITMTEAEYAQEYARSARLDDVVRAVATAVSAQVIAVPLEAARSRRLGPLDAVLDHCGLPDGLRAQLAPSPPANTAPPQSTRDAMLALNRSDLQGDAFRKARKALQRRSF